MHPSPVVPPLKFTLLCNRQKAPRIFSGKELFLHRDAEIRKCSDWVHMIFSPVSKLGLRKIVDMRLPYVQISHIQYQAQRGGIWKTFGCVLNLDCCESTKKNWAEMLVIPWPASWLMECLAPCPSLPCISGFRPPHELVISVNDPDNTLKALYDFSPY